MKFSWGTGIAILYSVFAAGMIFMVVKSFSYDNSLVVDDYYAKDLAYQEQMDKEHNTLTLKQDLKIAYIEEEQQVTLQFPEPIKSVSGEVLFYNPANQKLDFSVSLTAADASPVRVPVQNLHGRWKVKVDWIGDGKPYYKEEIIYIQ